MESETKSKYQRFTHTQHVLELPDTYIGSIEPEDSSTYICVTDKEGNTSIQKRVIEFIPGLYKIFDEIIVNAEDQYTRLKHSNTNYPVKSIWINILDNGHISISNTGEGIDIYKLPEHGVYPAELIFGILLTSTNYDKNEQKITGGKNGYGAKLTNIFSKVFKVETVDIKRRLLFKQTYKDNGCAINKKFDG